MKIKNTDPAGSVIAALDRVEYAQQYKKQLLDFLLKDQDFLYLY